MARTASGAITITDLTDGTNPITVFLSNENHTFLASELGVVTSSTRSAFSTTLNVFVGSTQATYDDAGTPANNTYDIGTITFSETGWSLVESTVSNQRVIKVVNSTSGVPEDSSNNRSVIATIPVTVKNNAGGTATVNVQLSLSTNMAGAGGVIIQLTPDKQIFNVDENGLETGTQTDASVEVDYQGIQGARTITSSVNGAAYAAAIIDTTNPIAAGSLKTLDITDPDAADKFTLAIENFLGTNSSGTLLTTTNTVSYRVASVGGGNDVVSFAKVQRGETGAGALIIVLETTGGNTFKNSTGTAKTVTVKIYDANTGSEIKNKVVDNTSTDNITYTWYINDTSGSEARVDTGTRNIRSSGGVLSTTGGDAATGLIDATGDDRFDTIVIGAEDVTTTQQFTCSVQVD